MPLLLSTQLDGLVLTPQDHSTPLPADNRGQCTPHPCFNEVSTDGQGRATGHVLPSLDAHAPSRSGSQLKHRQRQAESRKYMLTSVKHGREERRADEMHRIGQSSEASAE